MDSASIILVLLVIIAIMAVVAWLYVRDNGLPADLRTQLHAWLIGPRAIQRSFGSISTIHIDQADADDAPADPPLNHPATLMLADSELRELREEMQGQLRLAAGRSREFDDRLNDLEARLHAPDPATLQFRDELTTSQERQARELAAARTQHAQEIDRLRAELDSLQRLAATSSPAGERRGEALAELYGQLARIEAAMSQVINPVLLPGEPLQLPDEFFPESLVWDNWKDVGDRAFALGNAFNQNRIALDPETSVLMGQFVSTLRQTLTRAVYPNIKDGRPTQEQVVALRVGLTAIVAQLPAARQQLERAYRDHAGIDGSPNSHPA